MKIVSWKSLVLPAPARLLPLLPTANSPAWAGGASDQRSALRVEPPWIGQRSGHSAI